MPSQAEARSSSPSSSAASSSTCVAVVLASERGQRRPIATASADSVAMPSTIETAASSKPDSGAPRTSAGACSSASPNTPPSPVGSGQEPMRGNVETKAAASKVASTHTRPRHFSPIGLCAKSRQPNSASGASSRMAASPKSCMARSEKMAPGKPSRLWIGFCVAWLSEGSCTDQVASAMAPSSASVSSARPANSRTRRRTMSRKCSETKATMSRLRSAAGMVLPQHRDEAMQRFGGGRLVLHHGDADIVRAGI